MSCFVFGFTAVMRVLLIVAGGAAAAALALLVLIAAVGVIAVIFDGVTSLIARRWIRLGHVPRNRLEKIILGSAERRDV